MMRPTAAVLIAGVLLASCGRQSATPDHCTPRVCTPCDCGRLDNGCGVFLECGPCAAPGSDYRTVGCQEAGHSPGDRASTQDLMQDLLRDTAAPDRLIVDAPPLDQTVPPAAKLLYRVSFEKGTTAAEVGISKVATMSTGAVTVAPNPKKDARNSSNLVGRHSVGVGYNRAELSSQRLPTVNKLYSYRWSYYLPKDFFTQISGWMAISQWKTWPCGDHDGYATQICGSCGIFNEIRAGSTGLEVRFRAEPSCLNVKPSMATDSWVTFVLEIFWSNSNNGHARLWRNDQLVFDQKNFKTLFDNFKPGTCDVFWAVGLYSSNTKPLQLFTDNIEIWEGKIK